jgi:NADH-quinone oxidoreductase subunit G
LKINVGPFIDFETGFVLKTFFNSIGCSNISYQNSFIKSDIDYRLYYLLKNDINEFENFDLIILLGLNLRFDSPLLNSRFRKNFLRNHFIKFYSLGCSMIYSNYPLLNLGNSSKSVMNFINNKLVRIKNFSSFLGLQNFNLLINQYKNTIILLNNALSILMPILTKNYFNINIFTEYLGKIVSKELGFNTNNYLLENVIYNIGTDHDKINLNEYNFIIYQGSFKPKKSNLSLPTAFYTERNSTYMNLEGKIRMANLAVTAPKMALTDNELFRVLNIILIRSLLSRLTIYNNFIEFISNFEEILTYNFSFFDNMEQLFKFFSKSTGFNLRELGRISSFILKEFIYKKLFLNNTFINRLSSNYYSNDYLSRLSKTMAICAQKIIHNNFSNDIFYNNT